MKLTKREAVLICRDLWKWMAETGCEFKREWPGWSVHGKMKCNCPCCEYTFKGDIDTIRCVECPLKELWGDGYIHPGNGACLKENSPYSRWYTAIIEDRKKYATIIYKYCDKLLKKGV